MLPQEAAGERWRAALDAMDRLHHRQSRELMALHERQSAELGNMLRAFMQADATEQPERESKGHHALLEEWLRRLVAETSVAASGVRKDSSDSEALGAKTPVGIAAGGADDQARARRAGRA